MATRALDVRNIHGDSSTCKSMWEAAESRCPRPRSKIYPRIVFYAAKIILSLFIQNRKRARAIWPNDLYAITEYGVSSLNPVLYGQQSHLRLDLCLSSSRSRAPHYIVSHAHLERSKHLEVDVPLQHEWYSTCMPRCIELHADESK